MLSISLRVRFPLAGSSAVGLPPIGIKLVQELLPALTTLPLSNVTVVPSA